jgi:hypothetical protein
VTAVDRCLCPWPRVTLKEAHTYFRKCNLLPASPTAAATLQAASTLTEQQIKEVGGSSDGLTWFQWSDLGPDKRPSLAVKYSNWDTTYASLCDALRQQQPDGLFGFSQGATAAALFLAALQTAQRQGRDLDVPLPKFCIVVSGATSVFLQHAYVVHSMLVQACRTCSGWCFTGSGCNTRVPDVLQLRQAQLVCGDAEYSSTAVFCLTCSMQQLWRLWELASC